MIKVAKADLAKPRGMISSTSAATPVSDNAVLQDISATTKPMTTVFKVNNKYVCLPIEPMARLRKSKNGLFRSELIVSTTRSGQAG